MYTKEQKTGTFEAFLTVFEIRALQVAVIAFAFIFLAPAFYERRIMVCKLRNGLSRLKSTNYYHLNVLEIFIPFPEIVYIYKPSKPCIFADDAKVTIIL